MCLSFTLKNSIIKEEMLFLQIVKNLVDIFSSADNIEDISVSIHLLEFFDRAVKKKLSFINDKKPLAYFFHFLKLMISIDNSRSFLIKFFQDGANFIFCVS